MNDNWKNFLLSQGATIRDDRVDHFADPAAERQAALQQPVLCDLSHYGLIRAFGPEAEIFLQNQFSNDVREVTDTHSQYNAYCNAKGRVLAFFRLLRRGDDYLLRLPREILEPVLKRLRMFVLMTKVTLEDTGDALLGMGYSGPDAEQRLRELLGAAPPTVNECLPIGDLTLIRTQGPQPRFEIYAAEAALRELWENLSPQAQPVGAHAWTLLDIHAGIPEIVAATQEAFVPQMINLQALDALSFKKGCYPGQEIVARMHYLGKLKRRMYLAHSDTASCPQAGDALFAADEGTDQSVGKVVRAQPNPQGGVDLLAVIEIASADTRTLHLSDAGGPRLAIKPLPYVIEENGRR